MSNNKVENKKSQLDILEIIKEVKDSNIKKFKIKTKDVEIELESGDISFVKEPEKSPMQVAYKTQDMLKDDSETLANRINRYDESLLEELDYYPDLKFDMIEEGVIEMDNTGTYKYVQKGA